MLLKEFSIDDQHISCTDAVQLVEGSLNFVKAKFTFTDEWDNLTKYAVFSKDGNTFTVKIENSLCTIPYEMLTEGAFSLAIIGRQNNTKIIATTDTTVTVVKASNLSTLLEDDERVTVDILANALGKLEDVDDLVDSLTEISEELDGIDNIATKDYVDTKVATKSDTNHTHSYNSLTDKPTLVTSYNDLTDKPTIPSIQGMATETYVTNAISNKADKSEIITSYNSLTDKPTMFSGSYNDLTDKPTIPSVNGLATEQYVTDAVSNKADYNHTHNYNSLTNKPTIPDISGLTSSVQFLNKFTGLDYYEIDSDTYDFNNKNLQTLINALEDNKANKSHTHSYNSLTGRPTLVTSYNQLTDKPTIPSAYDDTALAGRVTAIETQLSGLETLLQGV